MTIKLPQKEATGPYLTAIGKLSELETELRETLSHLRDSGGGEAAAYAFEEILQNSTLRFRLQMGLVQFVLLRDENNEVRHGQIFAVANEIDETLFRLAIDVSELERIRAILPDLPNIPEATSISIDGEAAILAVAKLHHTAEKFRVAVKEHYGAQDPGGPTLTRRVQGDPFDGLAERLGEVWLASGRKMSGKQWVQFENILRAMYERLTGKPELPERRWREIKRSLRGRTSPL